MASNQATPERNLSTHIVGHGEDAITYDIHGDLAAATADRPPLFLFGAPMEATGFHQLAAHFTDRPVITYDPRGAGRNPSGTSDITASQHAADLHRVITALGVGPVDAFGSSGGAVNLLTLAAVHPDAVRTVVAHEPPLAAELPDRRVVLDLVTDLKRTYLTQGNGAAMAKFIAFVMFEGPISSEYLTQPAPDPAMFGLPTEDDGTRTNPLFRNMPSLIADPPDVEALRRLGDRLVIGAGVESGETMTARAARALAAAVGVPTTDFPSHHGGFLDQPGYPGDPTGFATRLREVLDGHRAL